MSSASVFDFQTDLSDLPHSRQHVSKRGVMSPQNGHIRCETKSPSRGCILNHFRTDAPMKARRVRIRTKNGRRTQSMTELPFSLIAVPIGKAQVGSYSQL
jgi:hypothetical protein